MGWKASDKRRVKGKGDVISCQLFPIAFVVIYAAEYANDGGTGQPVAHIACFKRVYGSNFCQGQPQDAATSNFDTHLYLLDDRDPVSSTSALIALNDIHSERGDTLKTEH